MAYIDTSKVTIPKGFFEDLNVPKLLNWLNSQPTEDVVPKSEAENYRSIAEHQQGIAMRRYFEIKQLKEELEKAKSEVEALKDDNKFLQDRRFKEWSEVRQEVAREIFEELENVLTNNEVYFRQTDKMREDFTKLKKKYMEEKQ